MNSHIIDSIALSNLRPNKPVIPLKVIEVELKLSMERDIQGGRLVSVEELDETTFSDYVNELIVSLEGYVYTKNRFDLYHKEGVGLQIALDEGEMDEECAS